MKFEKIIIPPGWKDNFTKYPNGRTIFEALSHTITTVNEGIEEVNKKVNQGLLSIEQAEDIIRNEITESFNILKLQLEGEIDDLSSDLLSQWATFQLSVDAQLAEKAKAVDVYTKQQVDAQLADKALKTEVGTLTSLLTTAKTSIVAAINELFNNKANKTQQSWITPTLENGATSYNGTDPYGYFKDEFGMVHLRGTIKTLGVGTAFRMFTLPIGYRPEQDIFKSVTSNFAFGNVTISKGGLVTPTHGNQNWFCLTGISFKAGA